MKKFWLHFDMFVFMTGHFYTCVLCNEFLFSTLILFLGSISQRLRHLLENTIETERKKGKGRRITASCHLQSSDRRFADTRPSRSSSRVRRRRTGSRIYTDDCRNSERNPPDISTSLQQHASIRISACTQFF